MYYYLNEKQNYYIRRGIEEEQNHNVRIHGMKDETYWTFWKHSANHTDQVYYNALCKIAEFWETYFEVSPLTAYANMLEERKALEEAGQKTLELARGLEKND